MGHVRRYAAVVCVIALMFSGTGCARQRELERLNRSQAETIAELNDEVTRLNKEIEDLAKSRDQLARTQLALQQRLKDELSKGDLTVSMNERGLVVTVLNQVLFDSGKATLKNSAVETLMTVGDILQREVPDHVIYVEGHTDSDPIRVSGFRSNWELSTTRATEVVHFFDEKVGISPERLVAVGYGEYQPVASNDSYEGKAQNRRVEIIVSPKKFIKQPLKA